MLPFNFEYLDCEKHNNSQVKRLPLLFSALDFNKNCFQKLAITNTYLDSDNKEKNGVISINIAPFIF